MDQDAKWTNRQKTEKPKTERQTGRKTDGKVFLGKCYETFICVSYVVNLNTNIAIK
jgi:hypothetical protein